VAVYLLPSLDKLFRSTSFPPFPCFVFLIMDLTDLNLTSTPPTFSPGSTLLANSVSTRLIIRSASSLSLVKTYLIPPIPGPTPTSSPYPAPEITSLSFSPNTTRLLAFCARAGTAFVFSLEDEGGEDDGVEAMLEGGVEGLVKVEWARVGKGREGKVILAWSELGVSLPSCRDQTREGEGSQRAD
jgi:hypothetical protein